MSTLDAFIKSGSHYTQAPQSETAQEDSLIDCFQNQTKVEYIYVGKSKGRYEQSQRGNFHYVGPNKGHFEKQEVPGDGNPLLNCCGRLCCLLGSAFLLWVLWSMFSGSMSMYDCNEGIPEAGWSDSKRQYCCEKMGIGCISNDDSGGEGVFQQVPEAAKPPPLWLDWWLADLSLSSKFILTMTMLSLLGCCCGSCILRSCMQAVVQPKRSPTQAEILKELDKTCYRVGATSGEITVTMMWETEDDLDLVLELPDKLGIISADQPECCGGILDIDGKTTQQRPNCNNIEHIYFPHYTQKEDMTEFDFLDQNGAGVITKSDWMEAKRKSGKSTRTPPPSGAYKVWCRIARRADDFSDIYMTVAVNVLGEKELFHHRLVPGSTEVFVASFRYDGIRERPSGRQRDDRF